MESLEGLQDLLLAELSAAEMIFTLELNGISPRDLSISSNTVDMVCVISDGIAHGRAAECPVSFSCPLLSFCACFKLKTTIDIVLSLAIFERCAQISLWLNAMAESAAGATWKVRMWVWGQIRIVAACFEHCALALIDDLGINFLVCLN